MKQFVAFSGMVLLALCVLSFISPAPAYDGPAGVTFRAPLVEKGAGSGVGLEGLSVRVKVRVDRNWSFEADAKGRAFPDRFMATVADSVIMFGLRNQGKKKVKTNLLIPYDASSTDATGFREPLAVSVSLGGGQVRFFRGPELARGMMKVRSFRVPVEIPAESMVECRITASHPLAVAPAWWQFTCAEGYARFPNYHSLAKGGCNLEFEFDAADEKLRETPLGFRWKKALQEDPVTERKHETIRFMGESIEWVQVSR